MSSKAHIGLIVRLAAERMAMHATWLDRLVDVVHRHDAGEIGARSGVRLTKRSTVVAYDDYEPKPEEPPQPKYGGVCVMAARADGTPGSTLAYELVDSIAVVGVGGVIAKYASQVNGDCAPEGTSVEAIRGMLRQANADNRVRGVLMVYDSPGGSVSGLAELAAEIRGNVKPVWSYTDDLTASAAYWLASQGARILGSRMAEVGSIGVYTVLYDSSAAAAKAGYTVHVVKAGDDKAIGIDGTAITPAQLSTVQNEINTLKKAFVADVAAGRRVSVEVAESWGSGRTWFGEQAKAMGLVDELMPVDAAIASMAAAMRNGGGSAKDKNGSTGGPRGAALGGAVMAVGGREPGKVDAMSFNNGGGAAPGVGAGSEIEKALAGGDATGAKNTFANAGGVSGVGGGAGHAGGGAATLSMADAIENSRREAIGMAADLYAQDPEIQRMAVEALTSPDASKRLSADAFKNKVRAHVADRAKGDPGNPLAGSVNSVSVAESGRIKQVKAMATATALGLSADPDALEGPKAEKIAKRLGYADAASARSDMRAIASENMVGLSLSQMVNLSLRRMGMDPDRMSVQDRFNAVNGVGGGGFGGGRMASHSTSDFPILLSNLANKSMMLGYELQETVWERIFAVGSVKDYKEATRISKSQLSRGFQKRPEGAPGEQDTFKERKGTVKVEKYTDELMLTIEMLVNDDLGAFTNPAAYFGEQARILPEELSLALLESNPVYAGTNKALFNADADTATVRGHRNLLTGAALSSASLSLAKIALRNQVDFASGKKLNLQPRTLLVPAELEHVARELLVSSYTKGVSGTASDMTTNVHAGTVDVVVSGRLTVASPNPWFLFADRSRSPLEVVFLDGKREPEIVQIGNGDPSFIRFQANIWGVGVGVVGYEGAVKNPGA